MSELEFLNALHVDLLRHDGIDVERLPHELFQTSTIQALLGGAFDGDVTLTELLEHGDLGLGTLNGLDGELIVIDGEVFKAELDCTLSRPDLQSLTPYAVVVPFTPGPAQRFSGSLSAATLERRLSGGPCPSRCRHTRRSLRRSATSTGVISMTSQGRWSDSASPTACQGSRSSASICTSSAIADCMEVMYWTTQPGM
jgi:Alpha-acetolactate decarboxylase